MIQRAHWQSAPPFPAASRPRRESAGRPRRPPQTPRPAAAPEASSWQHAPSGRGTSHPAPRVRVRRWENFQPPPGSDPVDAEGVAAPPAPGLSPPDPGALAAARPGGAAALGQPPPSPRSPGGPPARAPSRPSWRPPCGAPLAQPPRARARFPRRRGLRAPREAGASWLLTRPPPRGRVSAASAPLEFPGSGVGRCFCSEGGGGVGGDRQCQTVSRVCAGALTPATATFPPSRNCKSRWGNPFLKEAQPRIKSGLKSVSLKMT